MRNEMEAKMNVLVACEESQRVCAAFREKGHNAFSCDILPCSGGHPEWHIKQDVLPLLNGNCEFVSEDGQAHRINGKWDLIIAHPPCTYLTVAANKLYSVEKYGEKAVKRLEDREKAIEFFMAFVNADCDRKAIENPIGVISTRYRKPDQIIQPYQFGHPVRKSTCLWLYNLPKLTPTNVVDFECIHSKGKSGGYSGASWVVKDENGKTLSYKDPRVSRIRSKTYEGIAKAMAEQWGQGDITMDVREKLVEIMTDFYGSNPMHYGVKAKMLADHLISHGVTVQEWTSAKDRLPEEDTRVLVYLNIKKLDAYTYTIFDTDRRLNDKWVRWNPHITHWMPLPQPPKGEQQCE